VGSVLLRRQHSPEGLQHLIVWYKIRDVLFGDNFVDQDIECASVCEHPDAVWLAELFVGHDVTSHEEARHVFLACENDPRAHCFAGVLVRNFDEIRGAADLGDAFAQAWMAGQRNGEESFRWAEKSASQGTRRFLATGALVRIWKRMQRRR
jgi:hypothetical protein